MEVIYFPNFSRYQQFLHSEKSFSFVKTGVIGGLPRRSWGPKAKDLHVRLDSMLLVCLCYYFSFHLTVYSFSCNSRPLIFWLLRPIGFLKCVSGITEVRDNFRCWSRVVRLHADVYVFWQIFSVSHGVHFLILSFSGMVSAAVSLQTNSKWL